MNSSSAGGRIRLPTWVVRMRSMQRSSGTEPELLQWYYVRGGSLGSSSSDMPDVTARALPSAIGGSFGFASSGKPGSCAMAALQLEGLRGGGSSSCLMSTPSLAPPPEIDAEARTDAQSKRRAQLGDRPTRPRGCDHRRIRRRLHADRARRTGRRGRGERAALRREEAREFGAEQEDLRRVVNPHHHDDERTGGAERGGNARFSDVEPDRPLA